MQHSKINPTSDGQHANIEPAQQLPSTQAAEGVAVLDQGSIKPLKDDSELTEQLNNVQIDSSAPKLGPSDPENAKESPDRSDENQRGDSPGSGERKANEEGAERTRTQGSRQSNYLMLNTQTQQTIMEIIQTLRNNATPDAAEQLFKTLTETSEEIERSHEVPKEEDPQVDIEVEESDKKPASVLSIEDQLKLLLGKLNSNSKLKQNAAHWPAHSQGGNSAPRTSGGRQGGGQTQNLQGGSVGAQGSTPGSSQLITQAYHLINSVIMYPQIMWTRNFFYSLGAMAAEQQQIMHDWFIEMNEKQQIYIKEIERANDQLKETAASMFSEKGFSREQTDLFLKKVNFMENREYFFHKRRSMASRANGKDDDQEGSRDSSLGEQQENLRPKNVQRPAPKQKTFNNQQANQPKSDGRNFFDKLSSSCKLDDEQTITSNATSEKRFQHQDRGGRYPDQGYVNQRSSHYNQPNPHYRQQGANGNDRQYRHHQEYQRNRAQGPPQEEYYDGRNRGPRYPGHRGQPKYQSQY